MTKRYGRNQKRAHKARIQEIRTEVQELTLRVRYENSLNDRNKQIIRDTAAVLGQHFITLPPETLEIVDRELLQFGIRVMEPHRLFVHRMTDEHCSDYVRKVLHLPIMRTDVVQGLRGIQHLRVSYDNKVAGYAVSPHAVRYLDIKGIAIEMEQLIKDAMRDCV